MPIRFSDQEPLYGCVVAREGTTTGPGAATGDSFIDAGLAGAGANSFVSMLAVLYPGDPRQVDSKDITAFDTVAGRVTLAGAYKGVAAPIPAGVPYRIVTFRFVPAEVAAIDAKIGTSTDGGAAATLFGRHKKEVLAVHAHLLLVVHDASALDADLDTPLKNLLEEFGFEVLVADPADVAGSLELNFDGVIVSASCVAPGDVANLANLRTVDCPVICHSAAIAVSTVFNLGTTAGTEADKTQIEIVDNTVQWFLDQALADLTVTAAATIYTIGTKGANAVTLAEEDTGTGNEITCLLLLQGQEDDGAVPYAPDFDRVFFGLGNAGLINDTAKAIYFALYEHLLHEKRYSPEVVVTPKRVYQEDIPGTDFALAAIDTIITNAPPSAALDNENTVVEIPLRQNKTFVLRSLWVDVTDFGGGTQLTFQLWVPLNGTVTSVDSVVVNTLGIQNLMDIFGLPEVHADGIWITVITDAGATGACSGTFRYAESKK